MGTGISEHVTRPLDFNRSTPDEIRAFFAQCNEAANRPWSWQADLIEATRDAYEETKKRAPNIHEDLDAYNEFFRERATQAWYEKELVSRAKLVERALENGKVWQAINEAMHMGELYAEVRLKFGTDWEKVALAGRASARGSNDGAAKRAEAYRHRHETIRAHYADRLSLPGGESAAKDATAKKYGITRRQLNRILAK